MKKYIVAILSLIVYANISFAQTAPPDALDGNGKKVKVNRQIMLADELQRSGSYYNAIDIYLQEFQKDPDMYTGYNLAYTYFLARDYKNSETWFQKVVAGGIADYPKAQYYYALSLKMNAKYDQAITEFAKAQKVKMRGSEAAVFKRMAKNESKGCELAKALAAEPLKVEITHLGANINNNYTDFSPTYDPKTQNLVYASLVSKELIDLGASKKVVLKSKIFTAQRQGSGWTQGREIAGPFNDMGDQVGNGAYSADGQRFYFTKCEANEQLKMECKIYMSDFIGGEWSKPKELNDVNAPAGFTTTHPTVGTAKGGKEILYFSSNREGTVGGMDIWFSEIRDKGKTYTAPQNCGRKINTVGDEITPFFSVKEDLLYFSSNGLINIGGLDIFKTKGAMKSWDAAMNVGVPVNSSVDDFYYGVDNLKARTGFLVSNRPGGFSVKSETCCDDIYELKYIVPPVFTIIGRVLNSKDNTPIEGASVTLYKVGNVRIDSAANSLQKGFSFYRGTEFEKYTLRTQKDGFYAGEGKVSTVGLPEDDTLYIDITMTPIPIRQNIEVKNIYYELNKAELRPESFPSLDSLYQVLTNNPAILVEIGAHTDSRGTKESNLDLSQRRAQSVVDYLTMKGIEPARMKAIGYGESQLKNKCADGVKCTEEEHAINRRTEFTIVGEIPNTNLVYNQNEIDALKALEREKAEKAEQEKNKKLLDLQQLDEGEGSDNGNSQDQGSMTVTTKSDLDDKTTDTKTDTKTTDKADDKKTDTKKDAGKPQPKAGVDPALTKKSNQYEGNAYVNNSQDTKYILNPNPQLKTVMISDEFYIKLKQAGAVADTDFKTEKATELSDGTTAKGDIITLKVVQLGDIVMTNVDAKINTTITQSMVVGVAVVEANGCSFDTKNLKLKCK